MSSSKKIRNLMKMIILICGDIIARYEKEELNAKNPEDLQFIENESAIVKEINLIAKSVYNDLLKNPSAESAKPLLRITASNIERMLFNVTERRSLHPKIIAGFRDASTCITLNSISH